MCFSKTEQGWISRRFLIWFFVFLLIVVLVIGLFFFHRARILPIKTVDVHGSLSVAEQKQAQRFIKHFLLTSGFFSLNVDAMQSKLQQIPGVATVQVRRIWPNKLLIFLSNQSVMALWNDKYFINRYGETLPSNAYFSAKNSPKLYGPENSQVKVMDYYQRLSQILQPLNLTITELHFNKEMFWWLKLNNGVKIQLGDKQVLDRMQKLVVVYPKLIVNEQKPPVSVDMRYKHGMAVVFL